MAISYTYTSLTDAIEAWMQDHFSDFTGQIADIIGKGELRLVRDLDLELFDQIDVSVSTAASTPTIALAPNGILLRMLWVNGAFVEPRSEGYVYYYDDLASPGQPLYWAQTTEALIRLAPRPDAAYSTRQKILKRPTGLSASTATTWMSTNAGDLLFAACMASAEHFDKAPEDQVTWEQEYVKLLAAAKPELKLLANREYR